MTRHTLPIFLLLAVGVQTCSATQQERKELSEDALSLGNLTEQNTTSTSESNFTTATPTTTTTTPSPTFPPAPTPVAPNTTVQTFAVACMLDGVSCIVDRNASDFTSRGGAEGGGRSGDSRKATDQNNFFSRALDYFLGVLPFAYGTSSSSSTTILSHSPPETGSRRKVVDKAATEQYYFLGSMHYQEALDDVGWDILNLSVVGPSSPSSLTGKDPFTFTGGVSPSPFASAGTFSSSSSLFSLSTKYYALGYLEGFVTYKKILNHYANTYRDTIESVLAESPAVRQWLQKNKEWLYRYISVKTVADGSDVQAEKLGHVVMQVKGMADGFVDGCANVCDPAVMGPLLTSSPEMAFIAMQMFHELPDILAAHVTTVTPPPPPTTTTTTTATETTTSTTTLTTEEVTTTTSTAATTTSATDTTTTATSRSTTTNPVVTTEETTPTSPPSSSPPFAMGGGSNELLASLRLRRNAGQGSAIVKVVDGRRAVDLIAAHSTWGPYNSMMRQYKTYRWEGQNMLSMSSYPGLVASHDDYYLNGHGLTIMGSQLPMFGCESAGGGPEGGHNKVNEVLVSAMKGAYQSVPTVFRSLVASYLGRSVRQWEFYFVSSGAVDAAAAYEKRVGGEGKVSFSNPRLGSGADNKQWLIVDMKRFDGKHGSEDEAATGLFGRKNVGADDSNHPMHSKGCVLLVESMPREVQKDDEDAWELATYAMDLSRRLIDTGVFTLHGLAYLSEIAEANGQALMRRQNGTFFSYSETNRGMMASALADRLVSSRVTASSFLRLNRFDRDDFASYSRIPNCTSGSSTVENFLLGEKSCLRNVSAMLTFGARGDLNPAGGKESYGYLWPFVGRLNLGAIDVKVTSRNSIMITGNGNGRQVSKGKSSRLSGGVGSGGGSYTSLIISGPSNEDQPTFSFSTWPFTSSEYRHEGLPNTFDFPLVVVASAPQVAPQPHSRSATYVPTVGIVGATAGCIFGIIVVGLVTCTKYKKAPVRGYRPLKGSREQLAWLDRERYVRPQGGGSHNNNNNNNSIITEHRHSSVGGGVSPHGAQSQPHVGTEGGGNRAAGTTLYSPMEGDGGEAGAKFTYKNFRKAA